MRLLRVFDKIFNAVKGGSMKRHVAGFVSLFLAVTMVSCSSPSHTGGDQESGDAAVVGGEVITMADLDEAAKSQLQKVETQVYQIKRRILDDMVEEKLIAQAAKAKGMKVEDFLASEIEAKLTPPTEAEMKALYEARKDDGKQSFEEVKDRIRAYLEQNRRSVARRDLISRLRQASEVKISLSPPRMNIDTADLQCLVTRAPTSPSWNFLITSALFAEGSSDHLEADGEDYRNEIRVHGFSAFNATARQRRRTKRPDARAIRASTTITTRRYSTTRAASRSLL